MYSRVVKLNIGRNRKKLPWHDYLWMVVTVVVGGQIIGWVSGAGILLTAVAALAGGFVAGHLARYLALWLGRRFPALKSEHVGFFDR